MNASQFYVMPTLPVWFFLPWNSGPTEIYIAFNELCIGTWSLNTHEVNLTLTAIYSSTLRYNFQEQNLPKDMENFIPTVKPSVWGPWLTWLQPTRNRSTFSACSCCGTAVRNAVRCPPTPGSCWRSLHPLRGKGRVATARPQQPADHRFVRLADTVHGPLHSAARAKTRNS